MSTLQFWVVCFFELLFEVPLSEVKEICKAKDGKHLYVASEPYVGALLVKISGEGLTDQSVEDIAKLHPNTMLSLQHVILSISITI